MNHEPKSLVILAAGMGSRYGGPKQLEPLGPNGETILDYSIYDARAAGFDSVVLIIRREMQQAFEDSVAARWRRHLPVVFVYQELETLPAGYTVPEGRTKPWGTGQAVLAAAPAVNEPFAVINADDFYGSEAFHVLGRFLSRPAGPVPTYACVGFPLHETMTEHGDVNRAVLHMTDEGWLQDIKETIGIEKVGSDGRVNTAEGPVTIPGDTLVSMNFWGFTPTVFEQLQQGFEVFLREEGATEKSEFLLPTRIEWLIRTGNARVKILQGPGPWCGVTYPEDKPIVQSLLRKLTEQGAYPDSLW